MNTHEHTSKRIGKHT